MVLKARVWIGAIAFWCLLQGVPISLGDPQPSVEFIIGSEALAKKSGGRSSGGSFGGGSSSGSRSSGSRSRSQSSSSEGRKSSSSSSSRSSTPDQPSDTNKNHGPTGGRSRGGSFAPPPPVPVAPVPVAPVPPPRSYPIPPHRPSGYPDHTHPRTQAHPGLIYSTSRTSTPNWMGFMLWLLIIGGILFIAYLILHRRPQKTDNEVENNIVTVSKLQVAMLMGDGDIQRRLTELTLTGDTESSEGLADMLQESALALMRGSDRWCYVGSSSQTVQSRSEAQQVFEQLSLEERSKLSSETLVNIEGKVQQKPPSLGAEFSESGAYVVVTLLVGTADDQPLFVEVKTREDFKSVLGRLGSVSPSYLLVFELIWSPQEERVGLSNDELLISYSNLLPI